MKIPLLLTALALPLFTVLQDDDEWVPSHRQEASVAEDLEGVVAQDLLVDGDEDKRYFFFGPRDGAKRPKKGWKLLVILPGGTGDPQFHAFVQRIVANAVPDEYVVVQMVATEWSRGQFVNHVWPRKQHPWKDMEFTTEELVLEVIDEVKKRHKTKVDKRHVFALGWSSGGPPVYTLSMEKKTPFTGSFVAMSIFPQEQLPNLSRAKGHPYYLYHSRTDDRTTFDHAERAFEVLTKKKADVELVEYDGGHGWRGDVFGDIGRGLAWLEERTE